MMVRARTRIDQLNRASHMTSGRWMLSALFVLLAAATSAPQPVEPDAGVGTLLARLQQIVLQGDASALLSMQAPQASPQRVLAFAATELAPGATAVVLRERDRAALSGTPPAYRLIVDAFIAYGDRARVATWRLDVRRADDGAWRFLDEKRVSSTENLYRLALDPTREYAAHDLVIHAEDLELTLASGSVFVSRTDQGVTALVLLGHGRMRFHPRPKTEQGQVRIFCGSDVLDTAFAEAFVRINPGEFDSRVATTQVTPRAVDERDLRHAVEVFRQEVPQSYSLDLGDLSPDLWSTLPAFGDLLAEVGTGRFGGLTYARSGMEPEDITLFDRRHHHNIALYASQATLAARGPFYDEDDYVDYHVTDYDVDVTFSPEAHFLQGRATLRLKVRAESLSTITLRLADSLQVHTVAATGVGLLLPIRIRNQNSIVVSLPAPLPHGAETSLTVVYSGRLEPQTQDLETAPHRRSTTQPGDSAPDEPSITPEPSYLYSNSVFWYPQGKVADYATARMRITVPAAYDCVASGELADGSPSPVRADPAHPDKTYLFTTAQPIRYLAFVVSRLVRSRTIDVALGTASVTTDGNQAPTTAADPVLALEVAANPRDAARAPQLLGRAGDIARYYASILDAAPYPTFTVAAVDSQVPGGHSPAYFAVLDEPVPTTRQVWSEDPTTVPDFPEFFLAHELAHQWWGQAVGWRNYHEQWLSEGFAQYFAALYARHAHGDAVFGSILRRFKGWALDDSSQGPIYLGYRLGHIQNDGRVFRAIAYDKGADVLQMLRLLVGDRAFFDGLRRFYASSRFRKVGTEDFRAAMEQASGRALQRFFQQWVYGDTIPRLRFTHRLDSDASGHELVLRVDQVGDVFDVPVPVTIELAGAQRVNVLMKVTGPSAEVRVPVPAAPLRVEVRDDQGVLARFIR